MNFAMIPGGHVAFAAPASALDAFDKSPLNPVNMSRTSDRHTHDSAPSSKLLERVRLASTDLAELASVQAGWRFVTEKNNVTIYEMNGAVLPSSVSVASTFGTFSGGKASDYYLVKGVTTVNVGVDHVLSLLTTPATESFALRMNQIFGKHYENGVVIDHMSCTSPPAHFQPLDGGAARSYSEDDAYAVNWISLKAASLAEGARDFTIASYQDTYQRDPRGQLVRLGRRAARDPPRRGDATDRLMGVHAMSSFNFKDIPELPKARYTERLHFRNTGFVVEETHERGVVRLSFFVSLLPVATTLRSPKKYEKWLQALALSVGNLALQTMPVPEVSGTKSNDWKKKSDHCLLCLKSFYAFRRCHHCRFCGEAVCTKCSGFVDLSRFARTVQTLDKSAVGSNIGAETRGCTHCIQQLMEDVAHNSYSASTVTETNEIQPRRSSNTGSRSSNGTNDSRDPSRKLLSLSSATPTTSQNIPTPPLSRDDDELASLFSGGSSDRPSNDSLHSQQRSLPRTASYGSVIGKGVPRQRSGGAMSVDDLDQYDNNDRAHAGDHAPSSSLATFGWAKPPRPVDPATNQSLSMSTASTSFSNPSFADDRGSGPQSHAMAIATTSARATQVQPFRNDYYGDSHHLQLHDDETDIDAVPLFARSMVNTRSTTTSKSSHGNSNSTRHLPPRSTVAGISSRSGGDNSGGSTFKFSMMNQSLSLSSEPEAEPQPQPTATTMTMKKTHSGDSGFHPGDNNRVTTSVRSSRLNDFGNMAPSSSSSKLFSMSAGPRLRTQQQQQQQVHQPNYQPQPPQLSGYSQKLKEPVRSSSSSGSSRTSLPLSDHMIALPRPTQTPARAARVSSSTDSDDDDDERSDMILLAPKPPQSPQFVVFSDSHRASIFTRPGDGSDMIPLQF